jgi:hypothetical protein
MVAILSLSSLPDLPQAADIRIQPNPSLDTIGPFLPKAIFVIADITSIYFLMTQSSAFVCYASLP